MVDAALEMMGHCDLTADMISCLPSNIIDKILVCLPTKDAARTSILSKQWKNKWLYIPQLVFDHNDFALSDDSMKVWFQIYQALAMHRGTLNKFVLSVKEQMETETYLINQIIVILSGKDIQEFTLSSPSDKSCYRLVSTLFDCVQLRHLNLSACALKPPPGFGFRMLISVEFYRVDIYDIDLKTFTSKCPLLQRLTLEDVSSNFLFVIDAPNLKFLYFDCSSKYIHLRNVPVLATALIKGCIGLPKGTSYVVEVCCSLPEIEHFYASNAFIMYLSGGVIPESLPITLNKLKTLELELSFGCLKDVRCSLLLMKSSPILQKLTMKEIVRKVYFDSDDDILHIFSMISITQLLKDQSLPEYSFNQLQEVTLKHFCCTGPELEFLKLLLVKSLVLKKVNILLCKRISADTALEILKKVNRLRRASPDAEIIFQ